KDGGEDNFKVPPLTDILHPKIPPPLQPYPAYVSLFAGNLKRLSDGTARIFVPPTIFNPLGAGVGRALQAQGIKVVLSILSSFEKGKEKEKEALGWSTMTAKDNEHLVSQIGELKKDYNIDGIDIDDEYGPPYTPRGPGTAKNFYDTVHAIRSAFPDLVISNAVYEASPYGDLDKYEKFPDLGRLMTYCATMGYGNNYKHIIGEVQTFTGKIPKEKLYAGVQPGPINREGEICKGARPQAYTSIEVSEQVAEWAKTNCAGVMIFMYSTDTVEYTGCPQKGGWPKKDDHAWQKAITKILTAK